MNFRQLTVTLLLSLPLLANGPVQGTRLLRHPTVSRDSVAFEYAGDLWIVSRSGGQARRLTSHPSLDRVRGWTPDGRRVIFASIRDSAPQESYFRLWTIGLDGGLPEPLPLPRGWSGAYSPDGRRLAYDEITTEFTHG